MAATPSQQKWVRLLPEGTFTLGTFNVLAQVYTSSKYFPYAARSALRVGPRRATLLRQIAALGADVLCLQEIDDFAKFWKAELSALGFSAEFKHKPEGKHDGVVVAWKEAVFERGSGGVAESVEFDRFDECRPNAEEIAADGALPFTGCVALAVPLVHKSTGFRLVVASTHIVWRWRLPRLQSAQIARAFELARAVAEKHGQSALVLAGDFNSTLDSLPYSAAVAMPGITSVHEVWPDDAIGANVTTATAEFRGWIDHCFFSSDRLALSAAVKLPDEAEFTAETALPDTAHGSDHVPLCMEFITK